MHELSIAKSLIEMVTEYAVQEDATSVQQINIRIGSHSIVTRSLYTCFSNAVRGTMCENAELCIDEIPMTVFCDTCDEIKTPASRYNFRCPDCGTPTPKVMTGREMQLISLKFGYDQPHKMSPLVTDQQNNSNNNRRAL